MYRRGRTYTNIRVYHAAPRSHNTRIESNVEPLSSVTIILTIGYGL